MTVRQAIYIKGEQRFQVKFVQGSPGELDPLGCSHNCVFLVASTRLSSNETLKKQLMFEGIKSKMPDKWQRKRERMKVACGRNYAAWTYAFTC